MKTFLRIIAALIVLGLIVLLAIIFVPVQRTKPTEDVAADWTPDKGAPLYAARMSDCAACHTSEGGKPFAGGKAIESPMGAIYASNITPDKKTGIGNWTLADFRAALVDGVDDEGNHLYPAMPYENYRHLSEKDIRALYDYFMNDVKPVENEVQETSLSFPFNQRWGIRLWNWAALDDPGFHPSDAISGDVQLARGAYLVQGPGHCAACHSPRNAIMAEDGKTASSDSFLSGGEIDGWSAPDLRDAGAPAQMWSADQLKAYLTTGRNAHSAVTGEMALAVEHSLQYMTDEDADAMVAYLHKIRLGNVEEGSKAEMTAEDPTKLPNRVERVDSAKDDTTAMLVAGKDLSPGARLYMDNCAACHFSDGKGSPGVFPSLGGNSLVTADQTAGLIDVILNGAAMPSTATRPEALKMPGFAHRLSDEDVAQIASFLRGAWGNDAGSVDSSAVTKLRDEKE
ncbi:cytochrome C [Thioclava sp. F34-6]|uniref:cytochrome c n=1 Tax=Thioclava sp. F34-6 TaxID=1973003 RepID=UPI000B543FBF|nr:cytochrome c [Thioclava sp. F34-6]OWY08891.1 cytochrome C [Thioclava sp. F34-6]